MAAVSSILMGLAAAGTAASASEAYNSKRRQEGAMEDAIHERERQDAEQAKATADKEAKDAANKDLTQKRSKQRAARAGMTGRSSTILTSPLGEIGGAPAPQAGTGGKTLLGE